MIRTAFDLFARAHTLTLEGSLDFLFSRGSRKLRFDLVEMGDVCGIWNFPVNINWHTFLLLVFLSFVCFCYSDANKTLLFGVGKDALT